MSKKFELLHLLYTIKQVNNESVDEYVLRINLIYASLLSLSKEKKAVIDVNNNVLISCFLNGLLDEYKPIDDDIFYDSNLTFDEVVTLIKDFYEEKLSQLNKTNDNNIIHDKLQNLEKMDTAIVLQNTDNNSSSSCSSNKFSKETGDVAYDHTDNFMKICDTSSENNNTTNTTKDMLTNKHVVSKQKKDTSVHTRYHINEEKTVFSSTHLHRGLCNNTGENNCFLNVTIQALWHLSPFRMKLKRVLQKYGNNNNTTISNNKLNILSDSLLDCLCNLFIEYEFTDQYVLPPSSLRESLGRLSNQFQLGKIADANEAFDKILQTIHIEQSENCPSVHKCLSHDVFGGCIMEQSICKICGASSEPLMRTDFIICIQAAQLLYEAKQLKLLQQKQSPLLSLHHQQYHSSTSPINKKKASTTASAPSSTTTSLSDDKHITSYSSQIVNNSITKYLNTSFFNDAINTISNAVHHQPSSPVATTGGGSKYTSTTIEVKPVQRTTYDQEKKVPEVCSIQQSHRSNDFGKLLLQCMNQGQRTCPSIINPQSDTTTTSSSITTNNNTSNISSNIRVTQENIIDTQSKHRDTNTTTANTTTNNTNTTAYSSIGKLHSSPTFPKKDLVHATTNNSYCNGKADVFMFNLDPPLALALSIGWTSDKESPSTLTEFYSLLNDSIKLSDLFNVYDTNNNNFKKEQKHSNTPQKNDSINDTDFSMKVIMKSNPSYVFRGMVCYYGLHYISIFHSIISKPTKHSMKNNNTTSNNKSNNINTTANTNNNAENNIDIDDYLLFDDETIVNIGDWEDVKIKCIKSCYQPVLLLYELEK